MTTTASGMGHNEFNHSPEVKIDLALISMAYKVAVNQLEFALIADGDIPQPAVYISDQDQYIDLGTGEVRSSQFTDVFIVEDISYYNGVFTFKSGALLGVISTEILHENFSANVVI